MPKIKDVIDLLEKMNDKAFNLEDLKKWDPETEVVHFGNLGIPKDAPVSHIFVLGDDWTVGV